MTKWWNIWSFSVLGFREYQIQQAAWQMKHNLGKTLRTMLIWILALGMIFSPPLFTAFHILTDLKIIEQHNPLTLFLFGITAYTLALIGLFVVSIAFYGWLVRESRWAIVGVVLTILFTAVSVWIWLSVSSNYQIADQMLIDDTSYLAVISSPRSQFTFSLYECKNNQCQTQPILYTDAVPITGVNLQLDEVSNAVVMDIATADGDIECFANTAESQYGCGEWAR